MKTIVIAIAAVCWNLAIAEEGTMVFVASSDAAMPFARFDDGKLAAGILKELGDAIGAELGLRVKFVTYPRKRSEDALVHGEVDAVCYARPEWTSIKLNWTKPFMTNGDMLVIAPEVSVPDSLSGFSGMTLGTVVGYRYPELEGLIGQNFNRDDAANMHSNIQKILAGRDQAYIVDKLTFGYEAKLDARLKDLATKSISSFQDRCGFSPASKIPFAASDEAVNKIVRAGKFDQILNHYR